MENHRYCAHSRPRLQFIIISRQVAGDFHPPTHSRQFAHVD